VTSLSAAGCSSLVDGSDGGVDAVARSLWIGAAFWTTSRSDFSGGVAFCA
jgi:hypothetical protein